MAKLKEQPCLICGEMGLHCEVWTPDGTYWGDVCVEDYETLHNELELYWYHGGPIPEWMKGSSD